MKSRPVSRKFAESKSARMGQAPAEPSASIISNIIHHHHHQFIRLLQTHVFLVFSLLFFLSFLLHPISLFALSPCFHFFSSMSFPFPLEWPFPAVRLVLRLPPSSAGHVDPTCVACASNRFLRPPRLFIYVIFISLLVGGEMIPVLVNLVLSDSGYIVMSRSRLSNFSFRPLQDPQLF